MKRNDEKPTPKLGIEGGHWGLAKTGGKTATKFAKKTQK